MSNSPDDLDDDTPGPIDRQVSVPAHHPRHDELTKQLNDHLRQHIEHANTTADYGGHGVSFSSQGSFTGSGMSGASGGVEYESTPNADTPDPSTDAPGY